MRPDLIEILACPVCKKELTLTLERTETLEDGRKEILSGSLHCASCNRTYPIEDGIPNLLPPELSEALSTEDTAVEGGGP